MDALELRIADDEATSQETHHAPVYQSSRGRTDEDGLAEQMDDITQTQDIPNDSAPEVYQSVQSSRGRTNEDGLAEQMDDITQTQDIPKVSAPELSKKGQEKCDD
ncbi:hypothetical protein V500_00824 [Pseudogymnoascus sp. VKM F-4518 (FW-2643)]|nr:hypothetical protein V500_00824 [Pseudogymnoascus sp. VKM F-4518 (FW-2643)]